MIDEPTQSAATDALHPALAVGKFVGGLALSWVVARAVCAKFEPRPSPPPKREIATAGLVAIIALLGLQLVASGLATIVIADAPSASARSLTVRIVAACVVNGLASWIAIAFAKRRLDVDRRAFGFNAPARADFALAALLLLAAIPAFLGAAALTQVLVGYFGLPDHQDLVKSLLASGHPPNPLLVALIVVGVPCCEELLFRGVGYTVLARVFTPGAAVIASAAVFAALHDPQSFLLIFVVGLVLGVLRQRTGSLAASIFAHASFNGVMLARIVIEMRSH